MIFSCFCNFCLSCVHVWLNPEVPSLNFYKTLNQNLDQLYRTCTYGDTMYNT